MASGSRRGFLKEVTVTMAGLAASYRIPAWAYDTGATGSVQVWSTFHDRRHAQRPSHQRRPRKPLRFSIRVWKKL